MTQGYEPKAIESKIYEICEKRGYFEPNYSKDKNFCIMMPPPNVTGVLHIGHALTFSLQDIIVRYKRMDGYCTLYQPGLDHAGIATQNVVEKQLLAKGIKKQDIGREEFLKKVWQWKEESGGQILNQMRKLGITPAWNRLRFTMDKGLQNAVKKAFVQWYDAGLIEQNNYMINWCVKDGALSDIEVEYKENDGFLYHIKYPISESSDFVVIATTRPETFFIDSAVMVNPADERYAHLVGKTALLPISNKKIPIIADEKVDMSFGTGCVKVSPAHDFNDYEVGKRHNLDAPIVFDENGILNALAGEFQGLDRLEARPKIIEKLQNLGFIDKIEPHKNQVSCCYRCGGVIEPYISKQWFVKKEVAQNAIERVNAGESKFYPSQWINNYNAWMRDLRPWCISRQLWWGHRIPVWYCSCGEKVASVFDNPKCPKCGAQNLAQDNDVLDTWFSSGLWAFSTLGWGNLDSENSSDSEILALFGAQDLQHFYPNSLLITGFDILFFWVARMLLSGESLMGKLPFKDIYLHALVRDEKGQKMSKSKGNVIDPLEIINSHGADVLRFTLAILCAQGRDVKLSSKELDLNRNFANKIFNAAQFLLLYAKQLREENPFFTQGDDFEPKTKLGIYLDSQFSLMVQNLRSMLESYRFDESAKILRAFIWNEFCDWGIELAKAHKQSIFELGEIFKRALLALHPFMPFLSEYLYHNLCNENLENAQSIMIAPFPNAREINQKSIDDFKIIKDCVVSIRRIRANLELGNAPVQRAFLMTDEQLDEDVAKDFICKLARIENLEFLRPDSEKPKACVSDVGEFSQSFVQLEGIDLGAIKNRLNSQKAKLEKEIQKLGSMLDNPKFSANAPAEVIEQNKSALDSARQRLKKVDSEMQSLSGV